MGTRLLDQYSLLHFATGIIMYFWNISLKNCVIINIIYEIIENTNIGMKTITEHFKTWPGGKSYSDSVINSIGDVLSGTIGWYLAYHLDKMGNRYKWFDKHIK